MLGSVWKRCRGGVTSLILRWHLSRSLPITLVVAILLGAGTGQIIAQAGPGDRIVVANTGGTLSTLFQIRGALIVFGGGNARTELADLVGRTTLPWDRHVDLLIVPGWDKQQAIGALGLLERGGVGQVVILGQPDTSDVWNVLMQTAGNERVPVTMATGLNQLSVAPGIDFQLAADTPNSTETAEFALVSLRYRGLVLLVVDVSQDGLSALRTTSLPVENAHLVTAMRPVAGLPTRSTILLRPRAKSQTEIDNQTTSYSGEIAAGRRITVRLSDHELRIDPDAVQYTAAPTPGASPAPEIGPSARTSHEVATDSW